MLVKVDLHHGAARSSGEMSDVHPRVNTDIGKAVGSGVGIGDVVCSSVRSHSATSSLLRLLSSCCLELRKEIV